MTKFSNIFGKCITEIKYSRSCKENFAIILEIWSCDNQPLPPRYLTAFPVAPLALILLLAKDAYRRGGV